MLPRRRFSLRQLLLAMFFTAGSFGFGAIALRLWDQPWAHDVAVLTPLMYTAGALLAMAIGLLCHDDFSHQEQTARLR